MNSLFQDWDVNVGNPKGRVVLVFWRLCRAIRALPGGLWLLGSPLLLLYVVGVEWIMGIELGYSTRVGTRLRLYHACGLIVHPRLSSETTASCARGLRSAIGSPARACLFSGTMSRSAAERSCSARSGSVTAQRSAPGPW